MKRSIPTLGSEYAHIMKKNSAKVSTPVNWIDYEVTDLNMPARIIVLSVREGTESDWSAVMSHRYGI